MTTQAAQEPLTLADAKLYLRVDSSDEDALIASLISAAREVCEKQIGRVLTAQTWAWTLDEFPSRIVSEHDRYRYVERWWPLRARRTRLPLSPVTGIVSIVVSGTTVDPSKYELVGDEIVWLDVVPEPDTLADEIVVTFTAGRGATHRVMTAMRMLVAWWYEQRTPVQTQSATIPQELAYTITTLLGGKRPRSLA